MQVIPYCFLAADLVEDLAAFALLEELLLVFALAGRDFRTFFQCG
jgi:hypothetical protein|tara:strand:- start:2013 stop:2147 length:135 start_codon:yes stop_codon:yes gene_type:complete